MSSEAPGSAGPEVDEYERPDLLDLEDEDVDRDDSIGKSPSSSPDFDGDFSNYVHYTCRKCGDPCLNRRGSDAERNEKCWKCFSPKRGLKAGDYL